MYGSYIDTKLIHEHVLKLSKIVLALTLPPKLFLTVNKDARGTDKFLLSHFVVAVPELLFTVRTKLKELVEVVCIKLSTYKGILSQSVLIGSRQASEEGKIRRVGASCLAFGCVAFVFALFST